MHQQHKNTVTQNKLKQLKPRIRCMLWPPVWKQKVVSTSGYAMVVHGRPKTPKNTSFLGSPSPQGSYSSYILGDTTRPGHVTCVLVWSKSDRRRLRKTLHKQTNRQTNRHYENNGHLAVNQNCSANGKVTRNGVVAHVCDMRQLKSWHSAPTAWMHRDRLDIRIHWFRSYVKLNTK